jgi:hypothetical protein
MEGKAENLRQTLDAFHFSFEHKHLLGRKRKLPVLQFLSFIILPQKKVSRHSDNLDKSSEDAKN